MFETGVHLLNARAVTSGVNARYRIGFLVTMFVAALVGSSSTEREDRTMGNPDRRFHRACGLLFGAILALAACANQTGYRAASVDEGAAKVETRSADLQNEAWKPYCESLSDPLDWAVGAPLCAAGYTVIFGGLAVLSVIAPPFEATFAFVEWMSEQGAVSDTEERY